MREDIGHVWRWVGLMNPDAAGTQALSTKVGKTLRPVVTQDSDVVTLSNAEAHPVHVCEAHIADSQ